MTVECNVGGSERAFRIGFGTALVAAGLAAPMKLWMRVATEAVGLTSLVTGAIRYCPINKAVGRSSCERPAVAEETQPETAIQPVTEE